MIAIDPGTTESAFVRFEGEIIFSDILDNDLLKDNFHCLTEEDGPLIIEMIASYGMPVGKEVFRTCLWIGRFIEAFPGEVFLLYRKDIKSHLCGSTKAKDANVRQALIDIYGPGKEKAIGKKKTPGPLYGFKSHMWAALAVAETYKAKPELCEAII